ncbi:beta-ketoacyl-ACP synthase II [bacterium]|nr:beta-ketoacyl-ACP synthase II [bacterium]
MKHRVVITGLGAITPLGSSVTKYWEGLKEGKSGIASIASIDASALPVQFAGEVKDFEPTEYMDRKEAKRTARFSQFAIAAAKQAWADAGLDKDSLDMERVGVFIGSGMGALDVIEEETLKLRDKGADRVSPFLIPSVIVNMAGGNVAIHLGAKGPNLCHVSACSTGAHAIGDAFRQLQYGDVDVMLAGGTEATVTPLAIAGFAAAKALSSGHASGDPTRASRPFDVDRNGFVMGEGAGVLVLETLEHAQARGAKILAEVVGYGLTDDAHHITMPAPEGEGVQRAMKKALKDAGLSPEDVDYINAHGTSTGANDKYESAAYRGVFGEHAKQIPISSTKSMTGHLLGAAGAVEAIACVMAMNEGILPPTINLESPDPDCDLDYVPNTARKAEVNVCMSNNMGFGGHNASLVFRRFA